MFIITQAINFCFVNTNYDDYCIPGNFRVARFWQKIISRKIFSQMISVCDIKGMACYHGDTFVKFNFATEQNFQKFSDVKISRYTICSQIPVYDVIIVKDILMIHKLFLLLA